MSHASPPARDYRQHVEVETPEHVVLDLEIAGIGSRALAALVDILILTGGALAVFAALGLLAGFGLSLGRWGAALLLLGGFAAWTGYFIFFEALRRGQTPGKRLVGIRVLMDTGHAVTPGAAAARNLLRLADFMPPPYLIGLLLVAFHPRGKRRGDMVAGTIVARDRPGEAPAARALALPEAPAAAEPALGEAEYAVLTQ
ncbi:MAG TPA: RDD family protein, partial [Gemmatimonadales bacterium]|nr:RDD family protein [Gemmatimonadales bacterium]